MKPVYNFILILLISLCFSDFTDAQTLTLVEDNNIKLTVEMNAKSSIAVEDFIRFELSNKSGKELFLNTLDYRLDGFEESEDQQNNTIVESKFGSGTKYDLIHWFLDQKDLSKASQKFSLKAKEKIAFWKYPSNKAAIAIESSLSGSEEFCALLNVNLVYSDAKMNKSRLETEEVICTDWVKATQTDTKDLVSRFTSMLKDEYYQSVHGSMIALLIQFREVLEATDIKEIYEGIIGRKDQIISSERILLLKALEYLDALDGQELIDHYEECMKDKYCQWRDDFQVYWSNELIDELFNSRLFVNEIALLLELHSAHWKHDEKLRKRVYEFLKPRYGIDMEARIEKDNSKDWYNKIKYLSVGRDPELIEYLIPLLDDIRLFQVEDWSAVGGRKIIKDSDVNKRKVLYIRVCDVAFVSLLRILDQAEIRNDFVRNKIKPSVFIDNKWRGHDKENPREVRLQNPYTVQSHNLKLAEKYYYLYEENKNELLNLLKENGYK